MVKISIITVSYNAAKTIEQTIRSVVNQTYKNIEYIIIDGGSTDGTVDIIKKYEDKIAYWVSEPDKGIYDAMNKGIMLATGDYVYFLGADDKLLNLPTNILEKAKNDNIFVVLGSVRFSNGYVFHSVWDWKLKFNNRLHHQGMFIKKSYLVNNLYDIEYPVLADFDLNQKMFKNNLSHITTKLVIAEFSLDGISAANKHIDEQCRIVRKNFGMSYLIGSKVWNFMASVKKFLLGRKF